MSADTEQYIAERKSATESIVSFYCRKHHGTDGLCEDCKELLDYALGRIDDCSNNPSRTRCKGCPTYCYCSEMGDRMSKVLDDCRLTIMLHPGRYRRIYLRGHSIGIVSPPHFGHFFKDVAMAHLGHTLSVRSSSIMLDMAFSDASTLRASSSRLLETMII